MTTQNQYYQSLAELEADISADQFNSRPEIFRFVADNLEPSPYTEKMREIADLMEYRIQLENKVAELQARLGKPES